MKLPSYNFLRLLFLYSSKLQDALLYRRSYRYFQRYCPRPGPCTDPYVRCEYNNKRLWSQQLSDYQQSCFSTDNLGTCSLIEISCICGSSAITQVACCVLSTCSQADIDSKRFAVRTLASN